MTKILPNSVNAALKSLESRIWDLERAAGRRKSKEQWCIERWSFPGILYPSAAPPATFPTQGRTIEFGACIDVAGTTSTVVKIDLVFDNAQITIPAGETAGRVSKRISIHPLQEVTASIVTAGTGASGLTMYMTYLGAPQYPLAEV